MAATPIIHYRLSTGFLLVTVLGLILFVLTKTDIQLIKDKKQTLEEPLVVNPLQQAEKAPPKLEKTDAQHPELQSGKSDQKTPMLEGKINMDFLTFIRQVEGFGGGVFVYQPQNKKFVANINSKGMLVKPRSRKGLSVKARNVTRDIPPKYLTAWENQLDKHSLASRDYLVLLPNNIEKQIHSSIKKLINIQGGNYDQVNLVRFNYSQNNHGQLIVVVESISTHGQNLTVNKSFKVGGV